MYMIGRKMNKDCNNRKNEDIELVICSSLMEIKKSPIKFLGKASFHRLRNFLSGYAYALHAQMNYNTCFFLDFYNFLYDKNSNDKQPIDCWANYLLHGRTDEEAFYEFFYQLELFQKEKLKP